MVQLDNGTYIRFWVECCRILSFRLNFSELFVYTSCRFLLYLPSISLGNIYLLCSSLSKLTAFKMVIFFYFFYFFFRSVYVIFFRRHTNLHHCLHYLFQSCITSENYIESQNCYSKYYNSVDQKNQKNCIEKKYYWQIIKYNSVHNVYIFFSLQELKPVMC